MDSGQSAQQNSIDLFIATLIAGGVRDFVVSPGSRNAPLMIALSKAANVRIHSVIDERSAGYTALGLILSTRKTVAVCCTSGSAAANYLPAVTEAYYARLPLLVLTADRPASLIDRWDGQCIRQNHLYHRHVQGQFETPSVYGNIHPFETVAKSALEATQRKQPGPVHVNVPLREPLYSEAKNIPLPNVQEFSVQIDRETTELPPLGEMTKGMKVMVLAGGRQDHLSGSNKVGEIENNEIVFLADIVSGFRSGKGLEAYEGFCQTSLTDPELRPDLLLTMGTAIISKKLKKFLRENPPMRHYHLLTAGDVFDPFETSPHPVYFENEKNLIQFVEDLKGRADYREEWQKRIQSWRNAFDDLDWGTYSEFEALRFTLRKLSVEVDIHVANSMTVRYAAFLHANDQLCVYGNRGTSGIDGSNSTALGFAKGTDRETVLITGDLAFFYDVNGLWQEIPENFKIIVLNNSGGGIFGLIDGPSNNPEIAELQQTPVHRNAKYVSQDYGLQYFRASDLEQLESVFQAWQETSRPALLEIVTNKEDNKAFYQKFTSIRI